MQFLWNWRAAASPMGKWDAALVATINQLSTGLDEHGPDCLSQSTLLAVCCVLAGPHTCTLWLRSLLACPGASANKGLNYCLFPAQSWCMQTMLVIGQI